MILQVLTDDDRRGAQIFALDLGAALIRLGQDVVSVALAPGSVGGLAVRLLGESAKAPATLWSLRKEMRRASVVIAHGSTTLPACALASLGTDTPFVYRQISDSLFWAPSTFRRLRVRAAMGRAARVVALWDGSARVLETYFGVPREKLVVIPNGVPTGHFRAHRTSRDFLVDHGLRSDLFTALYVGALTQEKGVDLAIEAVARLADVQLLIVGDGPERQRWERLGRSLAPGRIAFAGSLEDPVIAYAAGDVFVLPSRGGDSMPAALIEAGLMGLPTISTAVEAIPNVIRDGRTGLILPVNDVPALQGAIAQLAGDRAMARAWGQAASLRCASEFSIEAVGRSWSRMLDSVQYSRDL